MAKFKIPLRDAIFKHIMQRDKKILATIISSVIKDISYDDALKGEFINVELVKNNYNEKGKFVDLVYKLENYIINIEANTTYSKYSIFKNNSYIKKLSVDYVKTGKKHSSKIKFIQINLDKYRINEYLMNRYTLSDIVTKSELKDNIEIYHINVDMIKNMAYNEIEGNKLYKVIMPFSANSWQELKEMTKTNEYAKEVEKLMKELLEKNNYGVLDCEEEMEIRINTEREDAKEEGEAIGLEKGEAIGKAQAQEETAKAMLKDGIDEEKISKYTGYSLESIKQLKLLL